ncbi:GIY-YIG nuclease family protein [Salinicola sp. CPA57]|uniref:GIY-YIG nuclease family protein n=1 Tax=Salinicola sp. CPA57 TaxID=1949080 RepID=UPI000DA19B36|nr:GIY-YIG nuclease family protein [Salinicola sp. CPA57]
MDCVRELEFDLPKHLLEELVTNFDEMPSGPLTLKNASTAQEAQGVYQIFHKGNLVYIGKTSSSKGLKSRLQRHAKKITDRENLAIKDVQFKAIRVYVFTAVDLERLLISHYKKPSETTWQNKGFGSNDPGKERDTTALKDDHFDMQFPIDLNKRIDFSGVKITSAEDLLKHLASNTSYLIRYEKEKGKKTPHPDLKQAKTKLNASIYSIKDCLIILKQSLSTTWQITTFPGHVIVYKNNKNYPHGIPI